MPFGAVGRRANTVLEIKNAANANIIVETIAIQRARFILSSFTTGLTG